MTKVRRIRVLFFVLFLIIGFDFAQYRSLVDVLKFTLLFGSAMGLSLGLCKESLKEGFVYGLICCFGVGTGAGLKYFTIVPIFWWFIWAVLVVVAMALTVICKCDYKIDSPDFEENVPCCIFIDALTGVFGISELVLMLNKNLDLIPCMKAGYGIWVFLLLGLAVLLIVNYLRSKSRSG